MLLLLESDPASGEAGAKRDENNSEAQGCFPSAGLALLLEDLGPDLLSEELNWSTSVLLLNQGLLCHAVKEAKASTGAML